MAYEDPTDPSAPYDPWTDPANQIPATPGGPNYRTVPGWMNPNTAPDPSHYVYQAWLAANPGYVPPGATTPPSGTPPPPGPTGPGTPKLAGLSYAEALAKAQAYYQTKWGVALSGPVLAQIKGDLGFQDGARVSDGAVASIASWIDGHKPSGPTPTAPPPTGPPGPGGFGGTPTPYASDPNAPTYTPLAPYVAPTWTGGDYVPPTQAELEASPGYQTRLSDRLRGDTRRYAAQGTILNGGTLRALDRSGQDYAQNEYQALRNNTLEDYKTRYGQFQDAAGMTLAARTVNAGDANTTFQNRTQTYTGGNTRTLSDYLTNLTSKRNSELDYWNRLMDLTKTGAATAGGSYKP